MVPKHLDGYEYLMGVDTALGQDHSAFRVHITKERRADGSYYYTATKQKLLTTNWR